MSDEIFAQGNVRITRTLASIAGISYPVNGITSVHISRKELSLKALLAGVVVGLVGVGFLQTSAGLGVAGLVLAAAIIYLAFQRPYRLMLRTAGAETQALEHKDGNFIGSIKSAIESAVAERG